MQVGSLVECVNNTGFIAPMIRPELNRPYTVRSMQSALSLEGEWGTGILLEEITNPIESLSKKEWHYNIERFKELQSPMEISIEDFILEPQNA